MLKMDIYIYIDNINELRDMCLALIVHNSLKMNMREVRLVKIVKVTRIQDLHNTSMQTKPPYNCLL